MGCGDLFQGKRREAWDEHGFAPKMAGRAWQAGLWVGALALLLSTGPTMGRPLLTVGPYPGKEWGKAPLHTNPASGEESDRSLMF